MQATFSELLTYTCRFAFIAAEPAMPMERPDEIATVAQRRVEPSSCILDDPTTVTVPRFGAYENRRDQMIGSYLIIREVGAGGMGVVYEAIDQRLKRRAAIKMIRGGGRLLEESVRRFQNEAMAVAQAHHPNIVSIYDVGVHEGQPYVALEYLGGGSLYAKAANKPQPPKDAAALVRTLADALQKAHASGVIHRDLKPANVLFSDDGVPKITDFGAARLTEDTTAGPLTQVGEVIGTPQYMAPEQARGSGIITPLADVYALGALLYHLLTGRPPHDGPDVYEVIHAAVHADPATPRSLIPAIPRELETICLKALEKSPSARYPTAAAMADDLSRFLAGDSILAKPDTTWQRLWKKAKRKPAIASLAVGLIVVSLAGLAGVTWQWQNAMHNASVAEHNQTVAELHAVDANISRENAEAALEKARIEERKARIEADEKEHNLYRSHVSEAALTLDLGDYRKAAQLLQERSQPRAGQLDRRHWEWHHLNRLGANHLWSTELTDAGRTIDGIWPHAMARSPDGTTLLVSGGNAYDNPNHFDAHVPAQWFLIDTVTGAVRHVMKNALPESASRLAWRDAETVVAAMPGLGTRVVHIPSGRVLKEWRSDHDTRAATEISPNGRYACATTSQRTVTLYDTTTFEAVKTWTLPDDLRGIVRMIQAGVHWRISVSCSSSTYIIDPDNDEPMMIPGQLLHLAAISPDGDHLALQLTPAPGVPGTLSLWSMRDRAKVWEQPREAMRDRTFMEFSPDGSRLAEVYNAARFVQMFDVRRGVLLGELRGHTNRVFDLHFHPDGRSLATASGDGSVRIWNTRTHEETARHRSHSTGARILSYDPNGWRLYSGGMDSRTIAWDLTRGNGDGCHMPRFPEQGRTDGGAMTGGLWFGPDGYARYLDTTLSRLVIFDPTTYSLVRIVELQGFFARWEKTSTDYAMDPKVKFIFGFGPGRLPTLWDANSGSILRQWDNAPGYINGAAISDDGTLVAANMIHRDPKTKVFTRSFFVARTSDGGVIRQLTLPGYGYTGLIFDRTKPVLYCGIASVDSRISGVHVLRLETGEIEQIPMAWPTTIRHLTMSPDNTCLAGINFGGGEPNVFAIRTDNSGVAWTSLAMGPATGLGYSPDGRRLACARFDDSVTIFDAYTGKEAFTKVVPSTRDGDYAFPARAVFSPDGRSLVTNHSGGDLSVWQTDEWNVDAETQQKSRRAEAEAAAFSYHLRSAVECRDAGNRPGWRFHATWLERLTPPNEFLKASWGSIRHWD